MSLPLIRRALEAPLKTYADAQSLIVAWQNVEMSETPAGRYLRAFVLPLPTLSPDLGKAGRRFEGIFQVSVVEPQGGGPGGAEAVVEAILALYPPATDLVVGSLRVHIIEPLAPAPAIVERDRYVIPCSLPYRADTY
jgi:hypothetical protein